MSASDWSPQNYFNYFTEVEEHFQKARGTALFLMSPLDWALIESWKNAGVPLEAVLRGIDDAFAKWRAKKSKVQMVNSLAFCTQAVLTQAQQMAGTAPPPRAPAPPPFELAELRAFLEANAATVRAHPDSVSQEIAAALTRLAAEAEDRYRDLEDLERRLTALEDKMIAAALARLATEAGEHYRDLEDLERRLTALEDKMIAAARARRSEDDLLAARREFDLQLRPYRSKMTADQIAMLERQFLDRRLLESAGLPRLSLFYL